MYFYVFVYMCSYVWDTKVKWGAMREKEDVCKKHNGICVIKKQDGGCFLAQKEWIV